MDGLYAWPFLISFKPIFIPLIKLISSATNDEINVFRFSLLGEIMIKDFLIFCLLVKFLKKNSYIYLSGTIQILRKHVLGDFLIHPLSVYC